MTRAVWARSREYAQPRPRPRIIAIAAQIGGQRRRRRYKFCMITAYHMCAEQGCRRLTERTGINRLCERRDTARRVKRDIHAHKAPANR